MDSATRMRSNGGKARAKLSKEVLAEIGRKGGRARAAAMSDSARSKAARRAVKIRWARVRAERVAVKPRKRRSSKDAMEARRAAK